MTVLEQIEDLVVEMVGKPLKHDYFRASVFMGTEIFEGKPFTAYFALTDTVYLRREMTITAEGQTILEALENLYWLWLKTVNDNEGGYWE